MSLRWPPRTQGPVPGQSAGFLDVNLEPDPLLRRIVGRATQGDQRIKGVFAAARSPLTAIYSRMMHEEDGSAFPTETQKPVLHGEPSIGRTFASIGHERGKIVPNERVLTVEVSFKLSLALGVA
jgi:hypothetical protein